MQLIPADQILTTYKDVDNFNYSIQTYKYLLLIHAGGDKN